MPQPRIVIVGAGFGGLASAKALRNTPASVILIDRTNHHLFQPLLYQVATSVLSPSQIATPIRGILRKQKNAIVILGEVTGVDKDQKRVFVSDADRENVPGFEKNWIQTVPGRAWFVGFRFYAPTEAYFDKSWPLPDVEKVK